MAWQFSVYVGMVLLSTAYSTDVPSYMLCDVSACSDVITNNDARDCDPGHELDNCIENKVLRDANCFGARKEATKTWLQQHAIEEKAHCGAEDIRNGCDFTVCSELATVVEIMGPSYCSPGRKFIACLQNQVLKDRNCKGDKKRRTEKGIDGLTQTETAKCGVKAIQAGCPYMEQCGPVRETTVNGDEITCGQSLYFIKCVEKKVVKAEDKTHCGTTHLEYTKEGLTGLKAQYDEHCGGHLPLSATNAAVSLFTLLVALVAAQILARY